MLGPQVGARIRAAGITEGFLGKFHIPLRHLRENVHVCLVEFPSKVTWSWSFVCRESFFFNYRFYFISSD